jgi:hypothetical protein
MYVRIYFITKTKQSPKAWHVCYLFTYLVRYRSKYVDKWETFHAIYQQLLPANRVSSSYCYYYLISSM